MFVRRRKSEYDVTTIINRGYLLLIGEYQIYFIECVENSRIFTARAKISMFSTQEMKNISYLPKKK